MEKLAGSIDKFLNFNEFRILDDKGKISHIQAIKTAEEEYEKLNETQKIVADFDKEIKRLNK